MRPYWKMIVGVLLLFVTHARSQSPVVQIESTGNYSGLIFSHESFRSTSMADMQRRVLLARFMYPSRTFGWGIEIPWQVTTINAGASPEHLTGWGDLVLITKYQFGVYHQFRFLRRERLLKAAVGIFAKLALPTAPVDVRDAQGKRLAAAMQPGHGAKRLMIGCAFHSDTKRYFWVHGHTMGHFTLSHQEFAPGASAMSMLSFTFARMSIVNRGYPFVSLKAWWAAPDRWQGAVMENSGGVAYYVSPGLTSVWHYYGSGHLAMMLKTAVQIRVPGISRNAPGPDISFYLATQMFFR